MDARKLERDKIHNGYPSPSHLPWDALISGLYAARVRAARREEQPYEWGNLGGVRDEVAGTSEGRCYSHSLNFVSWQRRAISCALLICSGVICEAERSLYCIEGAFTILSSLIVSAATLNHM